MIWNLNLTIAAVVAGVTFYAGTTLYVYNKGEAMGRRQVEIEWHEAMRLQANAEAEELMKARQREEALAALLAKQRKEHHREVNRIVGEYRGLVDSLRQRPEARSESPSGLPDSPDAGVGCTGQGLSKRDAEFLAGLAADAARTQAALDACQRGYEEVRQSLSASN
jgi:hypothetical protein